MADRCLRCAIASASDVPDQGLDKGVLKVAGVVVLGAVMSILDVTVVNVAINTLTFWWATGFVVIATLVSLLLPRTQPEQVDDPGGRSTEDEAVPVVMG